MAGASPSVQSGQKQPRRLPAGLRILFIALAGLLIAGGGGLIYYTTVDQPNLKHAQATTTAVAQFTATAQTQSTSLAENPYTNSGTLVLNDPLLDNSKGYGWQQLSDNSGNCAFIGGTYHVIEGVANLNQTCEAGPNFSDFVFEVQMKNIKGYDGGIGFRINTASKTYYLFEIARDGKYDLVIGQGTTISRSVIPISTTSAINLGFGQSNVIAVVASGSTISLYVNHQKINSVTDSTYSQGQIALIAGPVGNAVPAEVVYTNAKAWTLS